MFNKISINKFVRTLILSDFFLFFSVGLLAPIYAVFILKNITGRLDVIGYAVSFYWIARVVLVIPFSVIMDKIKGEFDEYSFMILGTGLMSIIPLFYIFVSEPWHIYLLQLLNGAANSMAVPAWRIVFTNHIDRRITGFEWSLEDVGVGLATAGSAALGALIADRLGFNALFISVFFFGAISTAILFALKGKKKIIVELAKGSSDKGPLKIDTIK
jgi:predicted MFS family arabinose efflux permease